MLNNIDRAKQFLPFDALKGFRESLMLVELVEEKRKLLLEDSENIINDIMIKLKKGDRVLVKYYYGIEYIECHGFVKKIDTIYKKLYLNDGKISFDDIIEIKKL